MAREHQDGAPAPRVPRPVVLVVDDEPLIVLLMAELIEAAGYRPVPCGDGHEAIAQLEQLAEEIAGVITDVRMPGVSGWGVASRARELVPQTPVVYVTGDSQGEWERHGVAGSALFEKPFTPSDVVETLIELIEGDSAAVA